LLGSSRDSDFLTRIDLIHLVRIVRRIAVVRLALRGDITSPLTDDERAWLAMQGGSRHKPFREVFD
jgi:hypothetical protein